MILQTIHCSVESCCVKHTETASNAGFPGWGHVVGLANPDTQEDRAHLCPAHLALVRQLLNGMEEEHGMDRP